MSGTIHFNSSFDVDSHHINHFLTLCIGTKILFNEHPNPFTIFLCRKQISCKRQNSPIRTPTLSIFPFRFESQKGKMSNSPSSDRYKDSVPDESDALIPLHQILHALNSEGHIGTQLTTILKCLQRYGRTPFQKESDIAPVRQSKRTILPVNSPPARNSNNKQARTLHWNTQADIFSLAAYRAGYGVLQIKTQLRVHGYRATVAEVAASLRRLGERNLRMWDNESLQRVAPAKTSEVPNSKSEQTCGTCTRRPTVQSPARRSNTQAERLSLAAYREGQVVRQIIDQLLEYRATLTEIAASLRRQRERDLRLWFKEDSPSRWNFQKTRKNPLALDAHRAVETVVTISPLLFRQDIPARSSHLQIFTTIRSTDVHDRQVSIPR